MNALDESQEITAEGGQPAASDGQVPMATDDPTSVEGAEDELTVTVRLNADLRRRLRRMAQRQNVRPEDVAQLLLAQALMNPAGDPVDDLRMRVDKLEKRVSELAAASAPRDAEPRPRFGGDEHAAPRREFDRPSNRDAPDRPRTFERDDRGPRPQRSDFDRPRPSYGDRPRSNFGERPTRSFSDRPPFSRQRDTEDRPAPRRDWEERAPRRSWDERPPRQDR